MTGPPPAQIPARGFVCSEAPESDLPGAAPTEGFAHLMCKAASRSKSKPAVETRKTQPREEKRSAGNPELNQLSQAAPGLGFTKTAEVTPIPVVPKPEPSESSVTEVPETVAAGAISDPPAQFPASVFQHRARINGFPSGDQPAAAVQEGSSAMPAPLVPHTSQSVPPSGEGKREEGQQNIAPGKTPDVSELQAMLPESTHLELQQPSGVQLLNQSNFAVPTTGEVSAALAGRAGEAESSEAVAPSSGSAEGGAAESATAVSVENPAPSPHGMSVALHKATMRPADEMNENSCPTEQNLPGMKASLRPGARDRFAAFGASQVRVAGTGADITDPGVLTGNRLHNPEPSAQFEKSAEPSAAAEMVRRATVDAVAGLRQANEVPVSVLLKPDAQTELSLHFKLQRGHLEAVAVLKQGDFSSLSSEWGQLQSRLAEQNIHLAPLIAQARAATTGGGQSFSGNRQPDNSFSADIPQPRFASSPVRKPGKPAVSTATGREWWA